MQALRPNVSGNPSLSSRSSAADCSYALLFHKHNRATSSGSMADAPEAYATHSTLEAVQHHPSLSPFSTHDTKFANIQHAKAFHHGSEYSTLELSPELDQCRFSTLKLQNKPDRADTSEKIAAVWTTDAHESPPQIKENWKRRRVCGVPMLFLLVGLVVVVAVIAAVVGGIVGSKSKSTATGPAQQKSGSASPLPSSKAPSISGGSPTSPAATATSSSASASLTPAQAPPIVFQRNQIYKIGSYLTKTAAEHGTRYFDGNLNATKAGPRGSKISVVDPERVALQYSPSGRQTRNGGRVNSQQWRFENIQEYDGSMDWGSTVSTAWDRNVFGKNANETEAEKSMLYWIYSNYALGDDGSPNMVLGIDEADWKTRDATVQVTLQPVNATNDGQYWYVRQVRSTSSGFTMDSWVFKNWRTKETWTLGFMLAGGIEGYEEAYLELQQDGAADVEAEDQGWDVGPGAEDT